MSELEQLKKRINNAGMEGVATAHIRDDYEPAGAMMIHSLSESGEFKQRRTIGLDSEWRIYKSGSEPY